MCWWDVKPYSINQCVSVSLYVCLSVHLCVYLLVCLLVSVSCCVWLPVRYISVLFLLLSCVPNLNFLCNFILSYIPWWHTHRRQTYVGLVMLLIWQFTNNALSACCDWSYWRRSGFICQHRLSHMLKLPKEPLPPSSHKHT